jgi:ABC-type transport system involved in multi-copper enzyme maturation permease subunit
MNGFFALAWNGFREARRNRVTTVVGAFAILLLASSTLVTQVTVHTQDRVLTDFGLSTMAILLIGLAVFLSCGLIPQEIERKTIFLVVSRPMSRSRFLLSRLTGNLISLFALLLAMTAVFFFELWLYQAPLTSAVVASLVGLMGELLVVTSVGFLFSTFSSQLISALTTVGTIFAGHLAGDVYRLASKSPSEFVQFIGKASYYLVPNLDRMNFRDQAALAVAVTPGAVLQSVGLAIGYSAVLIVGATIIFERRDFR